jgi:hypothetical protein
MFISLLGQHLGDETKDEQTRLRAAILLKNLIRTNVDQMLLITP